MWPLRLWLGAPGRSAFACAGEAPTASMLGDTATMCTVVLVTQFELCLRWVRASLAELE
jgi:hypothetical protein